MSEHHIPRKRFGQNFLKDQNIIEKIVRSLHVQAQDIVVEIGPGLGALTKLVLETIPHMHAIEIDRDLAARLIEKYSSTHLSVHQENALNFDFTKLVLGNKKLHVFGNLPYNISTPLLFHLLTYSHIIEDLLFMLQKEVVMRMAAKPSTHDYGRLSVMIQYACEVHPLFDVGPQSFTPPPKVMSCVVRLKPYGDNRPHPKASDEKLFASIVHAAFLHRRKTLKNALGDLVSADIFEQSGIDPIRRAETLSVTEYVHLSDMLHKQLT
jgi:16S rRNA (adenine1518-N6/adenine1519-N6)-dimethyltransferase